MAILSALISLLGKKIGTLLQAIFGWSITGLFGRLPSGKQTAISVALILSIAWPLLVVGAIFPGVAAWALAFVPLQKWIPAIVLRLVWLGLALLAPLVVGAITRWVAPREKQKGGALRTIVAGYPLTIGFFASFMITLFVVPILKIVATVKGWEDEHVYVQPRAGCYREVLAAIAAASASVGHPLEERPMPAMMGLATRVLRKLAKGAVDAIVADDPRLLRANDLELYLYPADLLVRGKKVAVARVRAAMARALNQAPAHLCSDPKAQEIEDELQRMWKVVARHDVDGRVPMGEVAKSRVKDLAATLDRAEIPYDDWVLLDMDLHALERAVCGGPQLVDRTPPLRNRQELVMVEQGAPHPEVATSDLLKEAVEETRELVKIEVALAKDEVKTEVSAMKGAAVMLGASAALGVIGLALLLVALVFAIWPGALTALVVGGVVLVAGGVIAAIGYRAVPKRPLERTRRRVETDVEILKEGVA